MTFEDEAVILFYFRILPCLKAHLNSALGIEVQMKIEAANELMERFCVFERDSKMNCEIIESIDDLEEKKKFRRIMGNIMEALGSDGQ